MGPGLTSGSLTEESTWTSATCGWRDARWHRRTIQACSFASCRIGVTWWHWSCAPASRFRNGSWRELRWTPAGIWSGCVTVAGRLLVLYLIPDELITAVIYLGFIVCLFFSTCELFAFDLLLCTRVCVLSWPLCIWMLCKLNIVGELCVS